MGRIKCAACGQFYPKPANDDLPQVNDNIEGRLDAVEDDDRAPWKQRKPEYMRGYHAGYMAGYRQGRKEAS